MIKTPHKLSLISVALAASLQLAACGGGSAGAPDTYPPTVMITSAAADGGGVVFTFTFNEDVGDSFTANDIEVTGGTADAASFARVSPTVYTVVVQPESAGATIQLTVRAQSFTDKAGNSNEVNVPAQFDPVAPTLTITDDITAQTASGDVVFTFSFNKAVSGFTAEDVVVTPEGATKKEFNMAADNLSATLRVTPPANSEGTIEVSVAPGAFIDFSDNANVATFLGSQAFNTKSDAPPASNNLLTNGDFENGTTGWINNVEVRTEGENSYFFADVQAAGNPWDVNLSYPLAIPTQGVKYKLTFKASSNVNRPLIAGIGLNQDPWTNVTQTVNLTTTPQTFTLELTSNFANASSRVLFDMGSAVGHVVIDDVVLELVQDGGTTNPSTPANSTLATFDEATPLAVTAFEGAESSIVTNAPAGGTDKTLKIARPGGQPWAGAWIAIPPIPSDQGTQTVSARVYSPAAGIRMVAKAEYGDNAGSGEIEANEAVVAGWQTLTWTFSSLNSTKVYNRLVLLPNLGTVGTGQEYFFDDVTVAGSGSDGGGSTGGDPTAEMGSAGPQAMPIATSNDQHAFIFTGDPVFAGDYIGALDANGNHAGWEGASSAGIAKNGNIGYYQDPLLNSSSQVFEQNGWVTGNIDNPGGVGGFFRYVLLRAPASTFANSYMGLYVNAPNNGTVDVSTYSNIKFKLWGPAEMYQQPNLSPSLQIILSGPKVAGCTATGSGGTEITKTLVANQKIGAGSSYSMSLAGWSVKGLCGADTNATAVNTVLTKLARFTVNVPGSSFNFTNAASDPTIFATGVNLGPIAFTK